LPSSCCRARGISWSSGIVVYQLLESPIAAAAFASASLVLFLGAWFGVPLGARGARRRSGDVPAHA
jgi:uncharacterized membrane protein YfcA